MGLVIATRGLPASGKSEWAKAYVKAHPGTVRINNDELRLMLFNIQFDPKIERAIKAARLALLDTYMKQGADIIVDNCNLSPKAMNEIETAIAFSEIPYELKVQDFTKVPLSECIERDARRGPQSVGKRVITNMWRQFLRVPNPAPVWVDGAPEAIICDIDGTLALMGGRNPYDASTADRDALNEPVANIVRSHIHQGFQVIYCSGREEKYRELTERWLASHQLFERGISRLLMRPTGDGVEDGVLKAGIYAKQILGNYNIAFVLDDRDRVVNAWRDLGLTCLQVADGDF